MGQLRCQVPSSSLKPILNHLTGEQVICGELDFWFPAPPLELNLRDLNHPAVISDVAISQIKAAYPQQPNVMLFIHGYNVGLGDPGKVLLTTSTTSSTSQQVEYHGLDHQFNPRRDTLYFSATPATICRLPQQLRQQFGVAVDHLDITDDRINGTAAQNWWRHMEYNLNKAAGFNGFDYHHQPHQPQYTRMLNVAWAGDPISPLDYMEVEPIAEQTAQHLLLSILKLAQQQIEINVIAHSAGNIVLIKLMELLGREHKTYLNHVFMWQPAMPDNVLSPRAASQDDSLTGFWDTGRAYLSAQQIHVFYSHHDNVLGPIPLGGNGKKQLHFKEKWHTPGGGKAMAITALSLKLVDEQLGVPNALKSCYHVAHLFHAPFNALLYNRELRLSLYSRWYDKYHSQLAPQAYYRDLHDQIVYVRQHYYRAFNDLALFISLYSAIKHDGVMSFLINLKNDKRLAEFLLTLPPRLAQHVAHNVAQAAMTVIDYDDWTSVFHRLSTLAEQMLSYTYLKQLWETVLHHSRHWLNISIHDFKDYMCAYTHDLLLHHPLYFIDKHIQINMAAWTYLQQHFHQQPQKKIASSQQGYALAQRGAEVAAFVITILNAPGTEPRPAMGYSGVDQHDSAMVSLIDSGKISCVDQSDFLWHHSAMKITNFSDSVFKNIYQAQIMAAEGLHFGAWL